MQQGQLKHLRREVRRKRICSDIALLPQLRCPLIRIFQMTIDLFIFIFDQCSVEHFQFHIATLLAISGDGDNLYERGGRVGGGTRRQ